AWLAGAGPQCGPRAQRPAALSDAAPPPPPNERRARRSYRYLRCRGAEPAPRAPAARRGLSRLRRPVVGPTTRRCRSRLQLPNSAVRLRGERQKTISLQTIRVHAHFAHELLATVEHCRGV